MRRPVLMFVLLVPALHANAGAESADVEAELQVNGLGRFTGRLAADAEINGAEFYTWNATQGPSLAAEARSFRYELWDVPYIRYTMDRDNPLGAQWYELLLDPELVQEGNSRGPLRTHSEFQNEGVVRAVASPDEPWEVSLDVSGALDVGRPIKAGNVPEHDDVLAQIPREAGDFVLGTAPWRLREWSEAKSTGPLAVALYGVNATLGTTSFTTGRWQDENYIHDPVGWSHGGMWHRYVLLVFADEAALTFTSPHHAPWSFHITELEGNWRGDLELSQARGEGTVNGASIPRQQHLFQVIGDFNAQVNYRDAPGEWKLEGSATFLAIDAQTLTGDRYAHLDPETLVLAVLAGGGLLAILWRLGPQIVALLGTREAWRNQHRARIARLLTWDPGLSTSEMTRRTGLSRATIRRHLYRLETDGWVSKHDGAKETSYTLNSGSSLFRLAGRHVRAYQIFAALQHPLRRVILEAAHSGPVDYDQICSILPEQGDQVAPWTFSRHARQLLEVGLLERVPEGKRVLWHATLDLQAVRRHYVRAFLTRKGCLWLYETLMEPIAVEEAEARLGHRSVKWMLPLLEALGLVENENGRLVARPV